MVGMALEKNMTAPDFTLRNQFGQTVSLSDFRGKKAVALVFFPVAFTGTCTEELCLLRDNISLFQRSDVELIAISCDNKASLRVFAEQEGYDFTLLSDFWPHGAVAREYGVFLENKGHADRATFLIDKSGKIAAAFATDSGTARAMADYERAVAELDPA
jgi:mycoredoxin-dependent peroxiredoxin